MESISDISYSVRSSNSSSSFGTSYTAREVSEADKLTHFSCAMAASAFFISGVAANMIRFVFFAPSIRLLRPKHVLLRLLAVQQSALSSAVLIVTTAGTIRFGAMAYLRSPANA